MDKTTGELMSERQEIRARFELSQAEIGEIFEDAVMQSIQRMGNIEYIDDQNFGDDDRLDPAFHFASIRTESFQFI
jgi:hypothetical protein